MAALEASIKEQYQRRLNTYAQAMKIWREAKFEELGSPTEEARFDFSLFLAKYFLDGSGRPCPDKTERL